MNESNESSKAHPIELERNKRIKIAYLHHDDDSSYFNSFYDRHLALLRRGEKISDDLPEVPGGTRFRDYIKPQFENADAIILFLSIDLEKDEYRTSSPETIALIDACHKKGTCIWKILAKFYSGDSVFQEYGDFLGKGKVIASSSSDEAFGQIVGEINEEVTYMLCEKWAQEGDAYYHQMRFDEALAAYDNSLYYVSDYPFALLGEWRIFRKREMPEEEEQYFKRLLSLDPSLPQKGKDVLSLASQRISPIRSYCKGCVWLDTENFNDAHTAFREVFQRITSPGDKIQKKLRARAYCGEGDTFIREGRQVHDFTYYYNQAFDAYQKAGSLDSDDPMYLTRIGDVHVALAEAYSRLNDRMQVRNHYYDALKNYEQVVGRSSYPPAFVGQGDVYFLLQQFYKALECYETALSYDQYSAQAYGGKGNLLLAFNKPEEALHAFKQALSIDDRDARYHYGKGQALTRLRHYQDALESYKLAVKYGISQSKEFSLGYARVLIELGDVESMYGQQSNANEYYAKAEDIYQRVFDPGRTEKDIEYGYGKIYFARKNWNVALICYSKALSLDPFMSEAYLGKGKTSLELGNYTDAFDCFNCANKYCQHAESMIGRADVEATYGDAYFLIAQKSGLDNRDNALEKACLYYERAITGRENAMTYASLGKTYALLGRDQEAIDALNHALELTPSLVQCYLIKGRCYDNLCQYSDAYAEYEKAFKAGLNTLSLQKAHGEVLLILKRYKEAVKVFRDMLENMIRNMTEYTEGDFVHVYCSEGIALHRQELDREALTYFFMHLILILR